jgi:hypothetical protein
LDLKAVISMPLNGTWTPIPRPAGARKKRSGIEEKAKGAAGGIGMIYGK